MLFRSRGSIPSSHASKSSSVSEGLGRLTSARKRFSDAGLVDHCKGLEPRGKTERNLFALPAELGFARLVFELDFESWFLTRATTGPVEPPVRRFFCERLLRTAVREASIGFQWAPEFGLQAASDAKAEVPNSGRRNAEVVQSLKVQWQPANLRQRASVWYPKSLFFASNLGRGCS